VFELTSSAPILLGSGALVAFTLAALRWPRKPPVVSQVKDPVRRQATIEDAVSYLTQETHLCEPKPHDTDPRSRADRARALIAEAARSGKLAVHVVADDGTDLGLLRPRLAGEALRGVDPAALLPPPALRHLFGEDATKPMNLRMDGLQMKLLWPSGKS